MYGFNQNQAYHFFVEKLQQPANYYFLCDYYLRVMNEDKVETCTKAKTKDIIGCIIIYGTVLILHL